VAQNTKDDQYKIDSNAMQGELNSMKQISEYQVAVIGMGIIGSRCADQLQSTGVNVRTWNRTPNQRADATSSAVEAASESDIIFFYLNTGKTCREVFQSIKTSLKESQLIINCSTVDLETTLWLARECESLGCNFIDCPFTGSKVAASRGELVYYVGGDLTLLEKYHPILEITSKEIIHMGKVGDATVVKIATNLISASTVQALSESMAIATAHGISTEKFIAAVSGNACGSTLSSMKLPTMAHGDYDTHFSLQNMLKDANFGLTLAQSKGLETPGIKTTVNIMQQLCEQGSASLDFSALYKQFD